MRSLMDGFTFVKGMNLLRGGTVVFQSKSLGRAVSRVSFMLVDHYGHPKYMLHRKQTKTYLYRNNWLRKQY